MIGWVEDGGRDLPVGEAAQRGRCRTFWAERASDGIGSEVRNVLKGGERWAVSGEGLTKKQGRGVRDKDGLAGREPITSE